MPPRVFVSGSSVSLLVIASAWIGAACVSSNESTPPIAGDAGGLDASQSPLDGATLGDASSLGEAGAPVPVGAIGAGEIAQPQHIAVDPASGDLYVASFTGSYSVFAPDGALVGTYGNTGATTLASAVGIALDATGKVYVGDYGANAVLVFDAHGVFQGKLDGSKSGVTLGRITGVAIDASGAVYACDDDQGRIVKMDASGNVLAQIATTVDGGANAGTTAVALDGTSLWVTKYYDHVVEHLDATGALLGTVGASGTGTLGTFEQPYAIAIDASRTLYVVDNGADTVQAVSASGSFAWIATPTGDAGPAQPTGVAVSKDGTKLYVSDAVGGRVIVYSL